MHLSPPLVGGGDFVRSFGSIDNYIMSKNKGKNRGLSRPGSVNTKKYFLVFRLFLMRV